MSDEKKEKQPRKARHGRRVGFTPSPTHPDGNRATRRAHRFVAFRATARRQKRNAVVAS